MDDTCNLAKTASSLDDYYSVAFSGCAAGGLIPSYPAGFEYKTCPSLTNSNVKCYNLAKQIVSENYMQRLIEIDNDVTIKTGCISDKYVTFLQKPNAIIL